MSATAAVPRRRRAASSRSGSGYRSPRRDAQAAETRERIVTAAIAVLAGGATQLTIPAIARRAGVAIPTVYHYFPDRDALVDAAARQVRVDLGVQYDRDPETLDDLLRTQRTVFTNFERAGHDVRAVLLSTAGTRYRIQNRDHRLSCTKRVVEAEVGSTDAQDLHRLAQTVMVVCSSPMATAFDRFGITGTEAADLVAWMTRKLVDAVKRRPRRRQRSQS